MQAGRKKSWTDSKPVSFTVVLINHQVEKFVRNFVVQKVQDPKENEENAIYIPVILNGLLTDGSNVLILVVLKVKVINLKSDTFGNPIFQKGLQNQPSSPIISVLGWFA